MLLDHIAIFIKNLYSHNQCCVNIQSMCTDWFSVSSGVRQGDSLSTTLFNIFINDLVDDINSLNLGVTCGNLQVSILLYADDIVLIADNETDLQKMLDQCTSWTEKWKLTVNTDKTKIMHIRKTRAPRTNLNFSLAGATLEKVKEYKYLGLVFNEHFDWNKTVSFLSSSAGRALGAVIAKFRHLKDVGYNTFAKLYNACVQPILEYGSEIWGGKEFKTCNQIQLRAIRYFLGVHRFAPIAGLEGDMGWKSPVIRTKLNMVKFWNRLLTLPDTRLTKQIFLWDYQQANLNWSKDMFDIFESINAVELFRSKLIANIAQCEAVLNDKMIREWKDAVESKPKLRTYAKLKTEFKSEDYIFLPRFERSLVSQLRLGILPLRIETGRYVNESLENRICTLCSLNAVEDEIHFVIQCPLYNVHREKLFYSAKQLDPAFESLSSLSKFVFLNDHPKLLSKFLTSAWNQRQSKIYKSHAQLQTIN